jgi:uncharacterized protein YndB with AHSA1/START domain
MSSGAGTVTKDVAGRRLIIERRYAASADLVWACFTRPRLLREWWGPKGWQVDVFGLDLRPGGVWRYRLRPEGEHELRDEQWGRAVYRVVESPRRLEFDDALTDASGTAIEGAEMPTTVLIEPDAAVTTVSITVAFTDVEQLDRAEAMGMDEGFIDALERLDGALATAGHPLN